ncbi:hypothetical protein [Fluviispira multicolorata]|uniref:Uncharacterized protein n=1 Tax=Fluviispira multicolorata TaxID=2654512 RepID=A0A833N0N2_9BACT|nr:hypothetical protein [Fluviispira multicolorata]KAB8029091.1 hypothetical protein GCL57_11160 [Fluviispira multicolorata]
MKLMTFSKMNLIGLTLAINFLAHAQEKNDGRPTYIQEEKITTQAITPLLNATPRSLAAQRLAPSAFPDEAEILCGYEHCIFGLTRGLVIGGDVFGMAYTPFRQYFDPNWNGGSLYIIDVFGGFQILRDVDNKSFMNAQLGYKRISYKYNGNTIEDQGFSFKVNYSILLTPVYLQGISFSGYLANNATTSDQSSIITNANNHEDFSNSAGYFYRISQKYPTYQLSFPGDLELANWGSQQTGLIAPIRAYAHIEPFYIQNNLNFVYQDKTLRKQEQNFGIRLAATASFESVQGSKAGRYSFLSTVGFDIQTSDIKSNSSTNADAQITGRYWISPYVNLAASWQF